MIKPWFLLCVGFTSACTGRQFGDMGFPHTGELEPNNCLVLPFKLLDFGSVALSEVPITQEFAFTNQCDWLEQIDGSLDDPDEAFSYVIEPPTTVRIQLKAQTVGSWEAQFTLTDAESSTKKTVQLFAVTTDG
jgi:hypothetical protein